MYSKQLTKLNNPIYFYSHNSGEYRCFSQWYPARFHLNKSDKIFTQLELDKIIDRSKLLEVTFTTAEQWMMACKALLFKDDDSFTKICNIDYNPKLIKSLGRNIKNFNETIWNQWKLIIVMIGNYLKFSQNKDICKILLDTKDRYIAEASGYDKIWGIGMWTKQAEKCIYKEDFIGQNLLGESLMGVREIILAYNKVKKVNII